MVTLQTIYNADEIEPMNTLLEHNYHFQIETAETFINCTTYIVCSLPPNINRRALLMDMQVKLHLNTKGPTAMYMNMEFSLLYIIINQSDGWKLVSE